MEKVSCSVALVLTVAVTAAVLLGVSGRMEPALCSFTELCPCLPALTLPQPPSKVCCDKLREQVPCLCATQKDPTVVQIFNLTSTKVAATTCHVPVPINC
ncbi:hypothetical protein Acr_00g0048440 [Actinidia rufa]|uniref:Bifunctional inhibitor/lipid-transfer protein/seed storage 2S albumin superfamily protein n=1 Tax=Actinidia rufa TaxID=165716 RepID=A0A7J0DK06_9ERIC|nr:hypothetical protein Acr_00g0048440 [Actinidia rufa]